MIRMRAGIPSALLTLLTLAALLAALGGCGDGGDIAPLANERPTYAIGYPASGTSVGTAFSADFLQSYAVTVPGATTIVGFRLWMASMTVPTAGKVGLYTDAAGQPGNLVTASDAVPLQLGGTDLPAPPTPVAPGTYWLVKRLSQAADVLRAASGTTTRRWLAYPFGDPWPSPMPVMGTSSSAQAHLAALAVD